MADEKPHPRWTDTDHGWVLHTLEGLTIEMGGDDIARATLPGGKKLTQGKDEYYDDFLARANGQLRGGDPLA